MVLRSEEPVGGEGVSATVLYGLSPLRRARQTRGVTLEDLARETRLSPRVLALIERGDFEALPQGLFARAHIRAYAEAIGLDGAAIVEQLADRLPSPADPLQALRARERGRWAETHPWLVALVDGCARTRDAIAAIRPAEAGRSDEQAWRRRAAGLVDGAALAACGGALIAGASLITGARADALLSGRLTPLLATWGLVLVLYVGVTGGLAGRTPGGVLTGWGDGDQRLSLSPRVIARRAVRMLLAEGSLVADLIACWRPWSQLRATLGRLVFSVRA